MGIAFGNNNAAEMYFGDKTVAEVYFGNKLVWSGKTLLMGNEKFICIEYTPDEDTVVSTITVFMNTDEPASSNDAWMWVIDEAGITVGFSTTSSEGSEEIRYKLAGYEHTNSFSNLTLKAGKKYYICHKTSQWDQGDHFFAYFKGKPGNYKVYNVGGCSQTPFIEENYNWIGKLGAESQASGMDKIITASADDYFEWEGTTMQNVLTSGAEYYRNSNSLSNYSGVIGSDEYRDLDSVMRLQTDAHFVWSGMNLSGVSAGNLYRKTSNLDSYTYRGCIDDDGDALTQLSEILKLDQGTFTLSSDAGLSANCAYIRTTACSGNYYTTPPEASYVKCNADAYKYVFDVLTGGNTGWNACVWLTNYVYTSGQLYKRGDAYTGQNYPGYFNLRAAGSGPNPAYRVDTFEKALNGNGTIAPSAGELVYLEVDKEQHQGYAPWYNNLMIRSNTPCDKVVSNDSSWSTPKTIANVFLNTDSGDTFLYEGIQTEWPYMIFYDGNLFSRTASANLAFTALEPITTEPANPQQDTIYYKGETPDDGTWRNQWGGSYTAEGVVKWNGTYWNWTDSDLNNYFRNENKNWTALYTEAATANIMSAVNTSALATSSAPPVATASLNNFTVQINRNTEFASSPVSADKKHYLAINGQEV